MCQIQHIDEMSGHEPVTLRLEQLVVTILRTLRIFLALRKIKKFKTDLIHRFTDQLHLTSRRQNSSLATNSTSFQPGDIVRVCSREQIMRTLDKNNKFEGCVFMTEMWQYCDSQQKVLKRVESFFDEARFKMRKTRNIVLLEGLHCSGKIPGFTYRCDRFCYFFWKEAWLEHVK